MLDVKASERFGLFMIGGSLVLTLFVAAVI